MTSGLEWNTISNPLTPKNLQRSPRLISMII
jgi:hypothetical protein